MQEANLAKNERSKHGKLVFVTLKDSWPYIAQRVNVSD